MKTFYALGCVLGIVVPFWQLVPALVLVGFILSEGRRLKIPYVWLPVVGTYTVGVSLGFPLFLLPREVRLEKHMEKQR